jgi:hypothetical protein
MSATVAILWLLFHIEIKTVTAGARKVYVDSKKSFSLEVEVAGHRKAQGEEFSLSSR